MPNIKVKMHGNGSVGEKCVLEINTGRKHCHFVHLQSVTELET